MFPFDYLQYRKSAFEPILSLEKNNKIQTIHSNKRSDPMLLLYFCSCSIISKANFLLLVV